MNKILQFCVTAIVFIACWNVLDFVYAELVAKTGYQFTVGNNLILPIVASLVVYLIDFLLKKKKNNK